MAAWRSVRREWPTLTAPSRFTWTQASIIDTLTFTHPNVDGGGWGWARLRFGVSGSLAVTGAGIAGYSMLVEAGSWWGDASLHASRFEVWRDANGLSMTGTGSFAPTFEHLVSIGNPFGMFETHALLPLNTPVVLSWSLVAGRWSLGTVAALSPEYTGLAGSAHARLDRSAFLLGFDVMAFEAWGVLQPVEGASVLSSSGYDWALAVPEPRGWWLWLAALPLVAARVRSARSQRRTDGQRGEGVAVAA